MAGELIQKFKQASLLKKLIVVLSSLFLLLLIFTLSLRVFLINLIIPYYLPEGSQASIGLLPIGKDGIGIQDVYFYIPDTVTVRADNLFIGYPTISEAGYGFSLLSLDNISVDIDSLSIKANSLDLHNIFLSTQKPGLVNESADIPLAVDVTLIASSQLSLISNSQSEASQTDSAGPEFSHMSENIRIQGVQVDLSLIDEQRFLPKVVVSDMAVIASLSRYFTFSAAQEKDELVKLSLGSLTLSQFDLSQDNQQTLLVNLNQLGLTNLEMFSQEFQRFVAINQFDLGKVKIGQSLSSPEHKPDQGLAIDTISMNKLSHGYFKEGAPSPHDLFSLESLDLNVIEMPGGFGALDIELISLGQANLDLKISQTGQLNLLDFPMPISEKQTTKTDSDSTQEQAKSGIKRFLSFLYPHKDKSESNEPKENNDTSDAVNEEQFKFFIKHIEQSSFSIMFTDRTTEKFVEAKAVEIPIAINSLAVTQLTNNYQDKAPKTTLKSQLSIGTHGQLELKLATDLTKLDPVDGSATLTGLELLLLSPYISDATGFRVDSGQVDSNIDLDIVQRHIQGNVVIDLKKVSLHKVDEEKAKRGEQNLSVPLPTALNLLKDKRGNIHLTTPVKGSLDDPDFKIGRFVTLVMAKAIKQGTRKVLSTLLTPVDWVIDPGGIFSGSKYNKLTAFPPVEFEAQSSKLTEANQTILENIADLLNKTPDMQVKLCAVSSAQDGDDQKQQKLAQKRAGKVSDFLQDKEVKLNQLLSCRSEINDKKLSIVYLNGT